MSIKYKHILTKYKQFFQLCGGGIRVKILIISGMNESLTYLCLLVFCPQKLGWLSLAERQEEMIEHAMRQTLTGGIANRISVRAHDSQLKSIKAKKVGHLFVCLAWTTSE